MLRVMSIKGAANAEAYYAQADYYLDAGARGPSWRGKGAELLKLAGEITREEFGRLLHNQKPDGNGRVTANHRENRRAVFDFTFSVPNYVTLLHSIAGDQRIESAFRESVMTTMKLVEAEAKVRVRVKKENTDRISGNLVYTDFLHHYSRPVNGLVDPQLHMHIAVLNMSFDPVENKWKALQAGDLKADAPYFQAVFRQELAGRLQRLGYELEVSKGDFEVKGVPLQAINEFSQRTQQIEAKATELGITTKQGKAKLGARTRDDKPPELSRDQLWHQWRTRISESDYTAIDYVHRASHGRGIVPEQNNARFVNLAMSHLTERRSVVPTRKLIADAMNRGLGNVGLRGVENDIQRRLRSGEYLTKRHEGTDYITTKQIMLEEVELVSIWKKGKRRSKRMKKQGYKLEANTLSRSQKAVVNHILNSKDGAVSVRGVAGTGKTFTMLTAKHALEANGYSVVALAPTGDASRNTMRSEGLSDADTIHTFHRSRKLQSQARDGVIFVDEASLSGVRDMLELAKTANRLNSRLVLWGDRRQHKSVPRGDVLGLLEDFVGIKSAELSEIRRQKGTYKRAVQHLSQGRIGKAFAMLESLGWIVEADHAQLAADYTSLLQAGESVSAIAPTHIEGRSVNTHIREALKDAGNIGEGFEFQRLRDLQWTDTERQTDLAAGHIVQFNRHSGRHRIGQRVTVTDENVADLKNRTQALSVYEAENIEIAEGDRIRATRGGYTVDRKHRLENGSSYTVKRVAEDEITLTNGWKIHRDFGHLTHGYVTTSIGAQGRNADHVLVAQSSQSYAASNQRQFYVSVSRGKKSCRVFCDNIAALKRAVARQDAEPTAHHALQPLAAKFRLKRFAIRFATRLRAIDRKLASLRQRDRRLERA